MKNNFLLASTLITPFLLNACGGSGGSNTGTNPGFPAVDLTGPGKITISNYTNIAYDALYAADTFNSHITSSIIQSIQSTTTQAKLTPFSLSSTTSTVSGKPIGNEINACVGGGTQSLAVTNTSIIWAYNDCALGLTLQKLIGSLDIINYAGSFFDSPQPCPASFSASLKYTGLGYSANSIAIVSNGTGNINLNTNTFAGSVSCDKFTINYSNLDIKVTQNTVDVANFKDFNFTRIVNTSDNNFTNQYKGKLGLLSAQGRIDAEITFLNAFKGNDLDDHPNQGTVILTAGTAVLTVTINNNISSDPNAISIVLDLDGDGLSDAGFPKNYSWDALSPFYNG